LFGKVTRIPRFDTDNLTAFHLECQKLTKLSSAGNSDDGPLERISNVNLDDSVRQ